MHVGVINYHLRVMYGCWEKAGGQSGRQETESRGTETPAVDEDALSLLVT